MSVKNVCMAQCLRGQGFKERKRVLLEQIGLPGRPMEGLLSPVCFILLYDFHSCGVKVGAAPKGFHCAEVCSLSRGNSRASLIPWPPPFTLSFSPLSITPHSSAVGGSPPPPLCISFLLVLNPGQQPAIAAAHTAPAIDNQAPFWQITQHFTDQWLSQI